MEFDTKCSKDGAERKERVMIERDAEKSVQNEIEKSCTKEKRVTFSEMLAARGVQIWCLHGTLLDTRTLQMLPAATGAASW